MHAVAQKQPQTEASGHKPSRAATAALKNQAHPLQPPQPLSAHLQPGLVIGAPGDVLESEADRLAQRVMRMPEMSLRRACACGGGCPRCAKKPSVRERVQTRRARALDEGEGFAPPIVHEVLSSSGQSLDTSTRGFMESRFGHDFSGVRVHTDAHAAESARAVRAAAYTVGHDVVFGAGRYAPNTSEGRFLLAHELTHVLQQDFGASDGTVRRLSRTPENHCTRAVMGVDNSDQIIESIIQEAVEMVDTAIFRMRGFQQRAWWMADEDYNAINYLFTCPDPQQVEFILGRLREMRIRLAHNFPYTCNAVCSRGHQHAMRQDLPVGRGRPPLILRRGTSLCPQDLTRRTYIARYGFVGVATFFAGLFGPEDCGRVDCGTPYVSLTVPSKDLAYDYGRFRPACMPPTTTPAPTPTPTPTPTPGPTPEPEPQVTARQVPTGRHVVVTDPHHPDTGLRLLETPFEGDIEPRPNRGRARPAEQLPEPLLDERPGMQPSGRGEIVDEMVDQAGVCFIVYRGRRVRLRWPCPPRRF